MVSSGDHVHINPDQLDSTAALMRQVESELAHVIKKLGGYTEIPDEIAETYRRGLGEALEKIASPSMKFLRNFSQELPNRAAEARGETPPYAVLVRDALGFVKYVGDALSVYDFGNSIRKGDAKGAAAAVLFSYTITQAAKTVYDLDKIYEHHQKKVHEAERAEIYHQIFDNPDRHLGPLLRKFGGSREKAYKAVVIALLVVAIKEGLPSGKFTKTIVVSGVKVTVLGYRIDWNVYVGTLWGSE